MKMSWACNPPLQGTKLLQIELFELESKAGCCIYKYLTGCCIFITRQLVLKKKKRKKEKKKQDGQSCDINSSQTSYIVVGWENFL